MRALIQRTQKSSLYVDGKLVSSIPSGLTVFLGVEKGDGEEQADYLARKLSNLRIFRDENGKMNRVTIFACGQARQRQRQSSRFRQRGATRARE